MLKKKTRAGDPAGCANAGTCTNRNCPRRMAFEIIKGPERLVGIGFRAWMSGYQTGDIDCWEVGWNHYARELGPGPAKCAIAELAAWVRCVHASAARPITVYPAGCAGFCADECMAISMIAAAQHSVCPVMRACAYALIGSSLVDDVIESGAAFASVLQQLGVRLDAAAIVQSVALARAQAMGPAN